MATCSASFRPRASSASAARARSRPPTGPARCAGVVEGLPSLATPFDGSYGTGTADISLTGGKLNVLMSASGIDPVTGANPFGSNGPEMGRLLALSISQNGGIVPPEAGEIIRVERDGSRTSFAPEGLISPTGIAVEGNNVYVSNQGLAAGIGKIVKLRLP